MRSFQNIFHTILNYNTIIYKTKYIHILMYIFSISTQPSDYVCTRTCTHKLLNFTSATNTGCFHYDIQTYIFLYIQTCIQKIYIHKSMKTSIDNELAVYIHTNNHTPTTPYRDDDVCSHFYRTYFLVSEEYKNVTVVISKVSWVIRL